MLLLFKDRWTIRWRIYVTSCSVADPHGEGIP